MMKREDADLLEATCRLGFGKRRKYLKNAYKGFGLPVEDIEKVIESVGIDVNARADDVTVKQWCNLGIALNEKMDLVNTSSSAKQIKE